MHNQIRGFEPEYLNSFLTFLKGFLPLLLSSQTLLFLTRDEAPQIVIERERSISKSLSTFNLTIASARTSISPQIDRISSVRCALMGLFLLTSQCSAL